MPVAANMRMGNLLSTWEANWASLGQDDAAVTAIDNAIDQLREDLLTVLAELD
jgi:hypothetical protein